jgi:hypothetical protein
MSRSKRRSSAEWQELVAAQAAGDQSIVEFCAARGLNRHTFQYWRGKLKRSREEPSGFVALRTARSIPILVRFGSETEVELPGDYPVEALVRLLKQGRC